MDPGLTGRTAEVTGASKGIRLTVVRALVVMAMSERAGSVTGADLVIDGGPVSTR